MANLMNVNNQAMPMGNDTGQAGDGQTGPKRHFKHIGELADESKAKVVIMYRTVPGEADNCLVVGTKFLPDMYHNALLKAVESEGGQDADEFADAGDAGSDSRRALDHRQRLGIDRAEPLEGLVRQCRPGQVVDMGAEVADAPRRVDEHDVTSTAFITIY